MNVVGIFVLLLLVAFTQGMRLDSSNPNLPIKIIDEVTRDNDDENKANRQTSEACECGLENKDSTSSRVVNGKETEPNKYPWMTYLEVITSNGTNQCGASVIYTGKSNVKFALTAAHCVDAINGTFNLYFGCQDTGNSMAECVKREANAILHELYVSAVYRNDIALLKFEPVECSDKIRPICLPKIGMEIENKKAKLTGWGLTSANGISAPKLQEADMTIRNEQICQAFSLPQALPYQTGTHICTIDTNRQSGCSGDFGGPLSLKDESGKVHEVGIFSFGPNDCSYPNIFTNVVRYLGWISRKIRSG